MTLRQVSGHGNHYDHYIARFRWFDYRSFRTEMNTCSFQLPCPLPRSYYTIPRQSRGIPGMQSIDILCRNILDNGSLLTSILFLAAFWREP